MLMFVPLVVAFIIRLTQAVVHQEMCSFLEFDI